MQMGYANYSDVECVFSEDKDKIFLIAKNDDENKKLLKKVRENNYFFKYSKMGCKNCFAYVEETSSNFPKGLVLNIKYFINNNCNQPISTMDLTGEDIDSFFSPSRYFYMLSKTGKLEEGSLVYKQHNADEWNIAFESQIIKIVLSYGNILQKGVASDLKLHPKLSLHFNATTNYEFVYRLYNVIVQFMKIVFYSGCKHKYNVDLYTTLPDGKLSYTGALIDTQTINDNFKDYRNINYNNYKEYIANLLQFCADNPNLYINHLPTDTVRFSSKDYNSNDFINIFSAFESECKEKSEIYENVDTSLIEEKRSELISYIKDISFSNKEEENFLKNAEDRISQLGTQYGQKKKIYNAYVVLKNALKDSIKNILYLHKLELKDGLTEKQIKDFADYLSKTRGKFAHGEHCDMTDKQTQILRLLEIIVYSQMLRRANIQDEDIELIIGEVFACNQKMLMKSINFENTQS